MSLLASRFLETNRRSPVVYCSIDGHHVTYRLLNGSVFTFKRHEARQLGQPRWAHLCAVA